MDIRLSLGFFNHLKTKLLKKECGAEGIVALIKLWCYAGEHKPTGNLGVISINHLSVICEWENEPQKLSDALFTLGFLERDKKDNLLIHNWEKWQPWIIGAEKRSDAARKAVKSRWDSTVQDENKPNTERIRNEYDAYHDAFTAVILLSFPFLSFPNQNIKPFAPSDKKTNRSKPKESEAEYLEKLDSRFKECFDFNKTIWDQAYPAIDIRQECKAALAWLYANPKNRKSNIGRFINQWLSRSQDRARRAE